MNNYYSDNAHFLFNQLVYNVRLDNFLHDRMSALLQNKVHEAVEKATLLQNIDTKKKNSLAYNNKN